MVTIPKLPLDSQSSSQPPSGAPLQQSDNTAQVVSTVPDADQTEEDEGDGDDLVDAELVSEEKAISGGEEDDEEEEGFDDSYGQDDDAFEDGTHPFLQLRQCFPAPIRDSGDWPRHPLYTHQMHLLLPQKSKKAHNFNF